MGILEPLNTPYSNRWFMVPKKNGTLRCIQDLQPVNKVTICNVGIGPSINEFAEALWEGPFILLVISTLATISFNYHSIEETSQQ